MEIALLNVKVTFQKNSVIADDIGNRRNVWEDYYTCHATVSGEGGQEKAAAGLTVAESDIAFTVRHILLMWLTLGTFHSEGNTAPLHFFFM